MTTIRSPQTFYMKEGDLFPWLELTLLDDDGNLIDFTDLNVVRITIAPCVDGRRIVDNAQMALEVVDEAYTGVARYVWQDGETDLPGEYKMEVKAVYVDDENTVRIRTLPASTYDKVIILPAL